MLTNDIVSNFKFYKRAWHDKQTVAMEAKKKKAAAVPKKVLIKRNYNEIP